MAQRGADVHVSTRCYRGTWASVADRLAVVKQRLFHAQAKKVHVVLPGAHSVVQQQVEAVVSLCTLAVSNRPFSRLPPPLCRLSLLPGAPAMCVRLFVAQASNATRMHRTSPAPLQQAVRQPLLQPPRACGLPRPGKAAAREGWRRAAQMVVRTLRAASSRRRFSSSLRRLRSSPR